MVEIINPGYYTVTCPSCKSGLKYVWSEVYRKERCIFDGFIKCPNCGDDVFVCEDFHYDSGNAYIDEGLLEEK